MPVMKKLTFILLFLLLTSGLALGSGSGGGGDSGGSGGGGEGGAAGKSGYSDNYDIGKRVFFCKLHCDSCPLSDLPLEQQSVAAIMPSLASTGDLGKLLSYRQRYAVKYFLKRRFDL
ncbi:hypothetical protein [Candidatus Spongiihabitans sp.]|uniref:hypothetical protein n=1 Tax=Candidatus Spongiihabitans sp. TaxID=3101308 RepID=UPI003C702921